MKPSTILLLIASIVILNPVFAQTETSANASSPMDVFRHWEGHWQGEGSIRRGPGEPNKSIVNEYVSRKLNGTIVLVEGVGTTNNPATNEETVVHHAFGVINFDQTTNAYKFQTYLLDGRSSPAWFTVEAEGKYQWGFDVPGGKIRYSITIDHVKNTWFEIGEFSADGSQWMKFFEMNLKKV